MLFKINTKLQCGLLQHFNFKLCTCWILLKFSHVPQHFLILSRQENWNILKMMRRIAGGELKFIVSKIYLNESGDCILFSLINKQQTSVCCLNSTIMEVGMRAIPQIFSFQVLPPNSFKCDYLILNLTILALKNKQTNKNIFRCSKCIFLYFLHRQEFSLVSFSLPPPKKNVDAWPQLSQYILYQNSYLTNTHAEYNGVSFLNKLHVRKAL